MTNRHAQKWRWWDPRSAQSRRFGSKKRKFDPIWVAILVTDDVFSFLSFCDFYRLVSVLPVPAWIAPWSPHFLCAPRSSPPLASRPHHHLTFLLVDETATNMQTEQRVKPTLKRTKYACVNCKAAKAACDSSRPCAWYDPLFRLVFFHAYHATNDPVGLRLHVHAWYYHGMSII